MSELEKDYHKIREKIFEERYELNIKRQTATLSSYFKTYISKHEGGKPHAFFCWPHHKVGAGPQVGAENCPAYYVCLKCGAVWDRFGSGDYLAGYINPEKESISTFISKEQEATKP